MKIRTVNNKIAVFDTKAMRNKMSAKPLSVEDARGLAAELMELSKALTEKADAVEWLYKENDEEWS
jgi:hypothetical protein